MTDKLQGAQASLNGPANSWVAVTLDADFTDTPQAVLVGVAGDLACVGEDGNEEILPVVAGYNPIRPRRINTTGTTATGLFLLYQ